MKVLLNGFVRCLRSAPTELMRSYERFEQLADSQDHVIPGHDPMVRSLYPQASSDLGSNVVRLDESPIKLLKDVFGKVSARTESLLMTVRCR